MTPNTPRAGPARAGDPLRARGLRLTAPRRVILDVVRASDGHPSAGVVYRLVRRRLPGVSLATVYRNLRMLATHGILAERADSTGLRFDGNTAPHDHFTCVACGRIYDVPPQARGDARRAVRGHPDFEVLDHHIEFYGRCPRCRERSRRRSTDKEGIWQARVSGAARASRI